MTTPAISIQRVGKRYQLGANTGGGALLSERLGALLAGALRREKRAPSELFWALRDVSLDVDEGDVVGLVGPNGAGKSTLLKLLSRVTPPTEGRIVLNGRVASLLEVGTGFHPELSGRENIFLNGAILGMRRREIAKRFDEIVEFSGIERFLATPVKRYSSGMYVRLAFAVAAHLESDILLVDEVLAVGDAEFQRKCLAKMSDAAAGGRTIIFVSHNMSAVQRLCNRAYLVEGGRVHMGGTPADVIAAYMEKVGAHQEGGRAAIPENTHRLGTGKARFTGVAVLDDDGAPIGEVPLGDHLRVAATLEVDQSLEDVLFEVGVSSTIDGMRVTTTQSTDHGGDAIALPPGSHDVEVRLDLPLLPGEFAVDLIVAATNGETFDFVERALTFSVLRTSRDGRDHYPWDSVRGHVRPPGDWSLPGVRL
jgi:lipopolysaccharide transport system ATP-binding protein